MSLRRTRGYGTLPQSLKSAHNNSVGKNLTNRARRSLFIRKVSVNKLAPPNLSEARRKSRPAGQVSPSPCPMEPTAISAAARIQQFDDRGKGKGKGKGMVGM